MKKTIISLLTAGLVLTTGLKAQTVQDGVNHLYADRFKSAISTFEKILAANPNNIEATYWLGQAYFEMDEYAGTRMVAARQLYEKALQTSSNAPLILVGMGHVELKEGKTNDARQKFEAAITATRTKKGDDPVILNAIGRANVDAKQGDLAYAIEKLEEAVKRDAKNPDILLNLGNAYRKARPGEGGGMAYQNYHKAISVNPKFARAYVRLAALFEAQKNWELMYENLSKAVEVDPQFTKAYYELFYYYWFLKKDYPEAEAQLNKYIQSKGSDTDIQDQFMYAQLCYGKKDYNCAIQKAQSVVSEMGDRTKPKVYRLLAYAHFDKGDFAQALKNSDIFFDKKNPDDQIAMDFKLRSDILSKTGGTPEQMLEAYMKGVEIDTVLESKLSFLKDGATFFAEKKWRAQEIPLREMILKMKPNPTINDYFSLTIAYYFGNDLTGTRNTALTMIEKYPNEIYGYEWAYNASQASDTVRKDSIAVPDAIKLSEFAYKDTTKFKKQYINAVRYLAAYYINDAKDKEKSLEYFRKWLDIDVANAEAIKQYIDQIEKMQTQPPKPASPNGSGGTKSGTPKTP